ALAPPREAAGTKPRPRLLRKNPEQDRPTIKEGQWKQNVNQGEVDQKNDSTKPEESGNTSQSASAVKASTVPAVPEDGQANRHEQASEEAAIVPYYNNFFNTYRLGPEDVISVSVFGQRRYSRSRIIVRPIGRISLALIPGGVFVIGQTVDEVAELFRKGNDETVMDRQVSVS